MLLLNQTPTTLNLLCFIKRSKVNSSHKAPLFLRISVDSQRAEISLKRFVDPALWDSKRQQVKGRTEEAKVINEFIRVTKTSLYNHYNALLAKGEKLTASILKNTYSGKGNKQKTLIEVFEYHNLRLKQQVEKGFSHNTFVRYTTCLKHIKEFILWKYSAKDIPLHSINYGFITDFEFYLRTEKGCNNNTTLKYISNFKKIVNLARNHGWMNSNPFLGFRGKLEPVDRDYLTEAEVLAIANKEFSIERLNIVRDVFIFSCFTGLSYVDAEKLSPAHIVNGIDGGKWLHIERTKTGVTSKIPLLPIPERIIAKYANNPQCQRNGKILPVISNQKVNAYLKEIADVCGIKKHLTFHVSRHTFATSITLANKVPIESVSKMLGHKSIKTTQIYSRVLDKKVSEDMSHLKTLYNTEKGFAVASKVQNL